MGVASTGHKWGCIRYRQQRKKIKKLLCIRCGVRVPVVGGTPPTPSGTADVIPSRLWWLFLSWFPLRLQAYTPSRPNTYVNCPQSCVCFVRCAFVLCAPVLSCRAVAVAYRYAIVFLPYYKIIITVIRNYLYSIDSIDVIDNLTRIGSIINIVQL